MVGRARADRTRGSTSEGPGPRRVRTGVLRGCAKDTRPLYSPRPDLNTTSLTEQVLSQADALAKCSEAGDRLTRRALTAAMKQAHEMLGQWCQQSGFEVRCDAAGNLRATSGWGDGRALLCGSHLDTIIGAGKYDGMLGVLLMLAAVQHTGPLPYPVEIVAFSDEEGVRFRRPYFGSRALASSWQPSDLKLVDAGGVSLEQALIDFGLDPAELGDAAVSSQRYFAFFEPHIEQGPVLESRRAPLGVVTAICAQRWVELSFSGRAGHAGTTPMDLRRDALAGAAEVIVGAERLARDEAGLLVTAGRIECSPNVGNAVPGECKISLDLRCREDRALEQAQAQLLQLAERAAEERSLTLGYETLASEPAVGCDITLRKCLTESLVAKGYPAHELMSGAGHDARMLAAKLPVAMLFLRSPEGLSHHPGERVLPEDVGAAIEVIAEFLSRLKP